MRRSQLAVLFDSNSTSLRRRNKHNLLCSGVVKDGDRLVSNDADDLGSEFCAFIFLMVLGR